MSAVRQDWRRPLAALHGELLRGRLRLGLSQEDLAERLGVPRRTFQRFEDGSSDPRSKVLFQWAGELGVSIGISQAGEVTS